MLLCITHRIWTHLLFKHLASSVQTKGLCVFIPAFLWVLISFVVELQGNFGIQADAKVVIHHTLLCAVSLETDKMNIKAGLF